MRNSSVVFVILMLFVAVTSCRKEEDPLESNLIGVINLNEEFGLQLAEVEMGTDYRFQSYFDLETNMTVASNLKTEWELAFSSLEEGYVSLNSAISDLRIGVYEGNWDDIIDPETLEYGWDDPTGVIEGLAIGNDFEPVYVLNRGLDLNDESVGFMKMRITHQVDSYTLLFADLNGDNEQTIEIPKDQTYNYAHLNLTEGLKLIEPPKSDFDIYFSQYLYIYDPETEPFPYLVTGCLINNSDVEVAEVFDLPYEDISWSDIANYEFFSTRDIIGFDWKEFDFEDGFITYPEMNFVIKSTEGDYYKLHFTSFYNDQFEKGYPQFEFQKLQEE